MFIWLPALRIPFYAVFTCTYLAICSVVALSANPSGLSLNLTVLDSSGLSNETYWRGLWGTGTWNCEALYNEVLGDTSEFNKAGSNNAGTIMALLPSLMAFAPIITANIGFLCHLSTTQGFFAAGFTFGLPVRQLDTWKRVSIKVSDLLVSPQSCQENLRPFSEMAGILLAPIKHTALHSKRPHRFRVQIIRLGFGSAQAMLIWYLLIIVPTIDSFYLIWLCPNWGYVVFSSWLGATFTILGWLRARFEKDSFGGDEVVYITSPSTGNYWRRLLEPHPMIVILRPSNDASEREPSWINRQITHYWVGMFQLFWLCFLSFLFSSTIGGTLFRTLFMVVVFIAIVGVSRVFSILVCSLLQNYFDLRVIEYENLQEKRMMQRLLGGLPGVLVDIRCVSYKKIQWQESVKMYQWGSQLSRGNVTQVSDDGKRCTLHTKTQRRDAIIGWSMRFLGVGITAWGSYFSPNWSVVDVLGPEITSTAVANLQVILLITAFAFLYLGRTRRLLICNCCS